jgi:uncharacterized repeat protein (TIGR03843 family)
MDLPQQAQDGTGTPITVDLNRVLQLLAEGDLELQAQIPWSSNYSFLVNVENDELACSAVYKPQRGERPLWDFRDGTLCLREYASFVVSHTLGWELVPPTVLREGPHGLGSLQLYVDADPEDHFFTLRDEYPEAFKRVAAFDALVNNADRKGGHCIRDRFGHIWCIDHGLTFNTQPKLRTVIWDFAGEPIPDEMVEDLTQFKNELSSPNGVSKTLEQLLSRRETDTLRKRLDHLLKTRTFPHPGPGRNVPWPLV